MLANPRKQPRPAAAPKSRRSDDAWYRERLDAANRGHNPMAQVEAGRSLFQAGYATAADKVELVARIIRFEGCYRGFGWAELLESLDPSFERYCTFRIKNGETGLLSPAEWEAAIPPEEVGQPDTRR